jgi:hypothetical protein
VDWIAEGAPLLEDFERSYALTHSECHGRGWCRGYILGLLQADTISSSPKYVCCELENSGIIFYSVR